ncbi:hypothetical protein ACWCXB_20605 [Streptomyces sp. NPDC001514]
MDSSYETDGTGLRGTAADGQDAAARCIDVTHLGRSRAPMGWIEPLPGGRLLLRRPEVLEVHERESLLGDKGFLSTRSRPVSSLVRPSGSVRNAAPTPDGGWVISERRKVWSVGYDGTLRWQLRDTGLPEGVRGSVVLGDPSVSPDGSLAAVVLSTVVTEPSEPVRSRRARRAGPRPSPYSSDVLLLLDPASGEVIGRHETGTEALTAELKWHPDGGVLAVSCWSFSWTTHWLEARLDGLHHLGGPTEGEAEFFVPRSERLLTMERAQGLTSDDDLHQVAVHDIRTSECLALFHRKLPATPDSGIDMDVYPLDASRVIAGSNRRPGHGPLRDAAHWLCDAETLRPLGRLRYPDSVALGHVRPLGDGTWLTQHGSRVDHWALP